MVVLAVVLVILAIIFDTGLMMPAFLFAALYYVFSINADTEYEYAMENGILTIDVIRGNVVARRHIRWHSKTLR